MNYNPKCVGKDATHPNSRVWENQNNGNVLVCEDCHTIHWVKKKRKRKKQK